ncbi:DUF4265 domain-containing protein [Emticicia sp. TH156]|uniref:DUF4265 domain-containing protein n=1 Tax=Emticicia sp. TH156 TaxID=2067454 RepID=UPI000C78EBA5|nr:DUF4265 domain-containing protein [Emticicia sp. TH156]PLK42062.1 hypothetical protein C0V77_22865 [Emticicia sp. TH156]
MIRLEARGYNPTIGRFDRVDPIVAEQEEYSTYQYGWNNPVLRSDPNGDCPVCFVIFAGLFFASQPASAPSGGKNAKQEISAYKQAYNEMGSDVVSAIMPVGKSKTVSQALYATVKKEVKEEIKEQGQKVVEKAMADKVAKAEQRAAKLSKVDRSGKDFTKAGKEAVIDLNKAKNNGEVICEACGVSTVPATKSTKGVTPSKAERQVDHDKPKSKGGSGTPDNGKVLCRDCNLKKVIIMKTKIIVVYKDIEDEISEETLWSEILENGYYKIDNIPLYAPNLALNDIINVEDDDGVLYFDSIIEYSGHSTLQIVFIMEEKSMEILAKLVDFGCSWEGMKNTAYFAIDVPPNADYSEIKKYLNEKYQRGILDYKEACLSEMHR